jgi:hypothetical protein
MKLTLYVQWVRDGEPYKVFKESSIDIQLPNSDLYYAFEAWMNLSSLEYRMTSGCIDTTIDIVYDIVQKECERHLGLTDNMYRNGVFDIDDPVAETKDYGYAYITVYVPKR